MADAEMIVPVVRAPREIAGASLPDLAVAVAPHLLGEGPGLVVDLSGTVFVSSDGLSQLIRVGMDLRDRGARLVLAAPGRGVDRLLRVVGLERVVPIFETVAAAALHLTTAPSPRR